MTTDHADHAVLVLSLIRGSGRVKTLHTRISTNLHLLPQTPQLRYQHTVIRDRMARRQDFVVHSRRIIRQLLESALDLLPFEPRSARGTPVSGRPRLSAASR